MINSFNYHGKTSMLGTFQMKLKSFGSLLPFVSKTHAFVGMIYEFTWSFGTDENSPIDQMFRLQELGFAANQVGVAERRLFIGSCQHEYNET